MTGTKLRNPACQKAIENVSLIIDKSKELPYNVFKGKWSEYLFIESGWVHVDRFVDIMQSLLKIDDSRCACILDLDAEPGSEWSVFFFDKTTTTATYKNYNKEMYIDNTKSFVTGRFGCTSEGGKWCIYCSKIDEIGVIAIRDRIAYQNPLEQLEALPLEQAIAMPQTYAMGHMKEEYRNKLLEEYKRPCG